MKTKRFFRLTALMLALSSVSTAAVFPSYAENGAVQAAQPSGGNLALHAKLTSNGYADGFSDDKANDGDYTSRWQSNIAVNDKTLEKEATVTLDFYEPASFDNVVIAWETARPLQSDEGYLLQYSKNGTDWKDISATYTYDQTSTNENNENVLTDNISFDNAVTGRYLRVCMFKVVDKYAPSIFEIEVYNRSGAVEDSLDTAYSVDNEKMLISGVRDKVTADEFKSNIYSDVTVKSTGDYIGTGTEVSLNDKIYKVIIKGDPSGDGVINSTDFMQIRRTFLNLYSPDEIRRNACDVNGDEKINSTDCMQVRRHYLDIFNIFDNIKPVEKNKNLMETSSAEAVVGEMLYLSASPAAANVLCNNSGMSGIEAPNHMTAALNSEKSEQQSIVTESMYLSSVASPVTFDIGHVDALGGLFIWNYNDTSRLNCGMKDVKISYSVDGKEYTDLGTFTLAKCSAYDNAKYGGNTATNTSTNNYAIDFNGIPARYVRISPLTNYGGNGYGLSEVRIFRHKETPKKGSLINAEGFTQDGNLTAYNAVNNTGINVINNATVSSDETVSNNPADMWLSNSSSFNSTYILNLEGTYPLDCIKIWNYNDPSSLGSGIKNFSLYITTTEACNINQIENGQDVLDFSRGNWTKIGNYTLPKGTGEDNMPASLTINLSGKHAQHIKIVPSSNHGGKGFGLSEIRAYSASGWAVELSRTWSGLLSSSGAFKYQGNFNSNPLGDEDNGNGWLGGDGVFTTPSDSDTVLFTFQDSFIGNFGNYTKFDPNDYGYARTPGFNIVNMKNMAYAVLQGKTPDPRNFQMYTALNDGLSNNYPSGNIYPERFWLADSTVIDNVMYVIAGQVSNGWGNGVFDLYKHSLNPDGSYNMSSSPEEAVDGTSNKSIAGNGSVVTEYSFNSIFDDATDGYIYLYGEIKKNDQKALGVARVAKNNFTTMKDVTYWTGSTWSSNVDDTAPISDYIPGGEANVTYMKTGPFAGKYVHIGTENTGFGSIFGTVVLAVSDSLTGPFKQPAEYKLYWATERYQLYQHNEGKYRDNNDYYIQWNYNAKAQPAISNEGELYITYHFGLHDDRVPSWSYFGAYCKEYEHATFVRMFNID